MKLPWCIPMVLLLGGCSEDDEAAVAASGAPDYDRFDDDDLPAGSCRDTATDTDPCDTEGTTIGSTASPDAAPDGGADQCQISADCMGGVCAASFDAMTLQRGPLACAFACVPLLDDTQWCSDDAACCDEAATCVGRGYCVLPVDGGTTG